MNILLAVVLTALLAACGGNAHAPNSAPPPAAGTDSGLQLLPGTNHLVRLPDLPDGHGPYSAWRQVSDSDRRIDGAGFVSSGGANNLVSGSGTLIIAPGGNDRLSWAVFSLDEVNNARPVQLHVETSSIAPGGNDKLSYWVLLSDYSTMRWNVKGPFNEPASLTLNSQTERSRFVSKQDGAVEPSFAYAVVTMGVAGNDSSMPPGEQPHIEIAYSDTTVKDVAEQSYLATNPHFARILSAGSGSSALHKRSSNASLELQFEHIGDPVAGGKCEAALYQFARKGPGDEVVTGDDIDNLMIGSVGQPITGSYFDPADNDPNLAGPPQPGETYRYYMRGLNATGQFSGWASFDSLITAPMPAVQNLQASLDVQEHVALSWDAVPGIKGYRLLRQLYGLPDPPEYLTGTLPQDSLVYNDSSAELDALYNYWVVPVGEGETLADDDDIDTVEEGAPLSLPAFGTRKSPLPPVALLMADVLEGEAPLLVNFDASASFDPDGGTILFYEWDFDGDGQYDESGDAPLTSQLYTEPGEYNAVLRVTDDENDTATDSVTIHLRAWHTPLAVASGQGIGTHSALALINGFPAVVYADDASALCYAVSNNADGDGSWSSTVIDPLEGTYEWPALAQINGLPAVSYLRNGNLYYAVSTEPDGSGSWLPVEVVPGPYFDYGTSLIALGNGNPAISAFNSSMALQVYAYSSTPTGDEPDDWDSLSADENIGSGMYSSLALVDGNPAISYGNMFAATLRYAWSSTAAGDNGMDWTIVTVDDSGELGEFTSLAVVDGYPAVSYHDQTNGLLKYAFSLSTNGTDEEDWSYITVDSGGAGRYSSLAVVQGRPAIAHYHGMSGSLKFAWSDSSGGQSPGDWQLRTLDNGDVGTFSSLATLASGLPAVSYNGNGELRFIGYR